MEKKARLKKIDHLKEQNNTTEEPVLEYPTYSSTQTLSSSKNFEYKRFIEMTQGIPFSQKEWASILHLSERTLHRYAKDETSFHGIYADKLLQIQRLLTVGNETFLDSYAFYEWLKKEKNILGQIVNFESLYSSEGIQLIMDQLLRIQYGVYS